MRILFKIKIIMNRDLNIINKHQLKIIMKKGISIINNHSLKNFNHRISKDNLNILIILLAIVITILTFLTHKIVIKINILKIFNRGMHLTLDKQMITRILDNLYQAINKKVTHIMREILQTISHK